MPDIEIEHVRRLDGRLLAVFLELLNSHNATTAADRLGLSQSAVSHALGRLRQLHDDPLFVRRPHGLEPTRKATELKPLIEEAAQCARRLYGPGDVFEPDKSDRRFRVAAPEFITSTIAGALLHRWHESAPGLSISFTPLDQTRAIDHVRRGEIELAIGRYPPNIVPDGLQREPLYTDDYCVVARKDHPTIAPPLDLASYLGTGHVIAEQRGEGDPGESIPRQLSVSGLVPSWSTALTIVASTDRIATCPRRLARQHADTLGLRILDIPGHTHEIEVALIRRAPTADAAIAWLHDEIKAITDDPTP
jgi:DNA-binding transcriptional LysR family regulator